VLVINLWVIIEKTSYFRLAFFICDTIIIYEVL
jgi:hypothetical protein